MMVTDSDALPVPASGRRVRTALTHPCPMPLRHTAGKVTDRKTPATGAINRVRVKSLPGLDTPVDP
jgi:hypothetical protein